MALGRASTTRVCKSRELHKKGGEHREVVGVGPRAHRRLIVAAANAVSVLRPRAEVDERRRRDDFSVVPGSLESVLDVLAELAPKPLI